MPPVDSYDNLPPKFDGLGYVYVLEFSTNVVKIGSTSRPATRLRRHLEASRRLGVDVLNAWISLPHAGYVETEDKLVRTARELGYDRQGHEWFRGLPFDSIVRTAENFVDGIPATNLPAEVERSLSTSARTVLETALTFPPGKAPCCQQLYEHQRSLAKAKGISYLGINAVKQALRELREHGYYSVQRRGLGRGRGGIKISRTYTADPAVSLEQHRLGRAG